MLLAVVLSCIAVGVTTVAAAPPAWAADFRPGSQLQALVDAALAASHHQSNPPDAVLLPAGNFSFGSAPFVVACNGTAGAGLRVHGAGTGATHLWFTPGAGVEVLGCSDLHLGGFSMVRSAD